jgi:uncharacterized protein YndB with AHSA1/START domain
MGTATNHVAKAELMIRKPVRDVFNAFIDPEVTTHFWFTKSTGKLETGKSVTWTWGMYDLDVPVMVRRIEKDKSIEIEWGGEGEATRVEWTFEHFADDKTIVTVINDGFKGTNGEIQAQVRDSTEGFALVLAGLKAWLEHGVELNLVADKHPRGLSARWNKEL